MATTAHHRVVIVGGGTAGISVAARLRKAKVDDIAIIEPSEDHFYQPLWTLVGGGQATRETTRRSEASLIPNERRRLDRAAAKLESKLQSEEQRGMLASVDAAVDARLNVMA